MSCLIKLCLLCAMYSPCCSGGSLARFALNSCTIFFWWSVRGGPVPVEGSRGWRLGGGARGCLGSMLEDMIGGRVGGCNCGPAVRTGPEGGGPPTRTTWPVDKIWCCFACRPASSASSFGVLAALFLISVILWSFLWYIDLMSGASSTVLSWRCEYWPPLLRTRRTWWS